MSASGSQRQPSAFQNIKLFPESQQNSALWFLKKNLGESYIVPANNVNALLPKDLTVLGSIINPSDSTLKENVQILSEFCSIDSILNLNPIKYNYIDDENKKEHFGLIAQELENFFPELVTETEIKENTVIKGINYIELIPIMLCKMQKMQTEIDELKLSINKNL